MLGLEQFAGQSRKASKLRIFLLVETQADLSSANIPKVK
jgi:hypothetical protein